MIVRTTFFASGPLDQNHQRENVSKINVIYIELMRPTALWRRVTISATAPKRRHLNLVHFRFANVVQNHRKAPLRRALIIAKMARPQMYLNQNVAIF